MPKISMRFYEYLCSVSSTRVECAKWKPFKNAFRHYPKLTLSHWACPTVPSSSPASGWNLHAAARCGEAPLKCSPGGIWSNVEGTWKPHGLTDQRPWYTRNITKSSKSYVLQWLYNELLHLHCSFSNHMFEPVEFNPRICETFFVVFPRSAELATGTAD